MMMATGCGICRISSLILCDIKESNSEAVGFAVTL